MGTEHYELVIKHVVCAIHKSPSGESTLRDIVEHVCRQKDLVFRTADPTQTIKSAVADEAAGRGQGQKRIARVKRGVHTLTKKAKPNC